MQHAMELLQHIKWI